MKVTGETLSFHHQRKGAEGARYQKYPNLQAKGLLLDRTLKSFIPRNSKGATPNLSENPYRVYFKELFLNHIGRIFQVKRQSEKSNISIFLFGPFVS